MHDPRAADATTLAAVILPSDEVPMPTQDGVGRDDRADLGERFPAQSLCLRGQPSALIVVEPEPLASELLFQDPVFLAEILDDALLLI